jgi:hypothetical protein
MPLNALFLEENLQPGSLEMMIRGERFLDALFPHQPLGSAHNSVIGDQINRFRIRSEIRQRNYGL